MDIQKTIRDLTRQGVIVTPELMERVKRGESIKPSIQKKPRLSVKIRNFERKPRLSVSDVVSIYNNTYSVLVGILRKKMDFISINKARDSFSDVSVAGMVRDITPTGFVLEDATGEIEVIGSSGAAHDDVVGVSGNVKEGKLFMRELIWPDVPLTNKPSLIPDLNILMTTHIDDRSVKMLDGFNMVFVPNRVSVQGDIKTKIIDNLPNPCHAAIKRGNSIFSIIIYKPRDAVSVKDVILMLKKRHMMPKKEDMVFSPNPFVIEHVPDLMWVISDTRHVECYKGVTVVMTSGDDAVKFDAGKGKVCFARLNSSA